MEATGILKKWGIKALNLYSNSSFKNLRWMLIWKYYWCLLYNWIPIWKEKRNLWELSLAIFYILWPVVPRHNWWTNIDKEISYMSHNKEEIYSLNTKRKEGQRGISGERSKSMRCSILCCSFYVEDEAHAFRFSLGLGFLKRSKGKLCARIGRWYLNSIFNWPRDLMVIHSGTSWMPGFCDVANSREDAHIY